MLLRRPFDQTLATALGNISSQWDGYWFKHHSRVVSIISGLYFNIEECNISEMPYFRLINEQEFDNLIKHKIHLRYLEKKNRTFSQLKSSDSHSTTYNYNCLQQSSRSNIWFPTVYYFTLFSGWICLDNSTYI